jgi:hypothetical protein
MPTTYNSLGTIQSAFYQGDYQFVKEKVLELTDRLFHKLQEDLVDSALSTTAGFENGSSYSSEMLESETGDVAP